VTFDRRLSSREASGPTVVAKRVLVTGATGFIGRHLVDRLLLRGYLVRSVGRRPLALTHPHLTHHSIADVRDDFADSASECDCLVHLAGLSDASTSYERAVEFAAVNVVGTVRALDAARRANAAFVLASSMRVYRPSIRQLSEEAPRDPIDPYGLTKLQAEEWTEAYARLFGVRATILRIFSVYGPGQTRGKASGVVSIFLETARSGQPLRVRARQLRDFVDVRDVARAIELAIQHPPEGVRAFNVGTGRSTSVAELGEMVRNVVGTSAPMIVDLSPGAESYVADPRKAETELGFQCEIELLDGLVWYNRHLEADPGSGSEPPE
jgi:UDP-glucose 4-epimerase